MNIIIASSIQADSGYEEKLLTKLLYGELKKLNHNVDCCFLPFHSDVLSLPEQVIAYQMIEGLDCDLLITIGYPAIYLNHSNKVSYMFQLVPTIYEYYDTNYGVSNSTQNRSVKLSMYNADKLIFKEAKKIFVNSVALFNQIKEVFNIKTEVLYLPDLLENAEDIKVDKSNYIVTETDLFPESRYEVLLDILVKNKDLSLILSIPRTSKVYKDTFEKRIHEYNLHDKIEIIHAPLTKNILKNALCYVSLNYLKTKISNALVRAHDVGLSIIVADDSFAESEIGIDYHIKPNESKYSNAIFQSKKAINHKLTISSIRELASRMVSS